MTRKKKKNEKVLHTRIPADLEQEIKERAEKLRIPVSNLVRNILEDAFKLVQNVGTNVDNIVGQVTRDAGRLSVTAVSHAARVAEGFTQATRMPGMEMNHEETSDDPGPVPVEQPDPVGDARSRVFAWQPVKVKSAVRKSTKTSCSKSAFLYIVFSQW